MDYDHDTAELTPVDEYDFAKVRRSAPVPGPRARTETASGAPTPSARSALARNVERAVGGLRRRRGCRPTASCGRRPYLGIPGGGHVGQWACPPGRRVRRPHSRPPRGAAPSSVHCLGGAANCHALKRFRGRASHGAALPDVRTLRPLPMPTRAIARPSRDHRRKMPLTQQDIH